MSTTNLSLERPRVVCHVDASSTATAVVKAAGSYCRKRDAELLVVWVLEPSSFHPTPLPLSAGGTGIWGLSGAAAAALELARSEGITARAVVRIGDPGRCSRRNGGQRAPSGCSPEPTSPSSGRPSLVRFGL